MSVWAFYGRVSGIEQASNNSIPTQREACHARARERGAAEVRDFVDAGVPGDLAWTDRPALTRLLELVEAQSIAGVVIYDPDRLARDLGVQLAVTEIIAKNAVQLEFCTQQYDASPEGMLFYQLRGAIAQFERAKIRERTNRGRKKILREGIPANKPPTYGLSYDRPTNTWSIVAPQAEVVRQIFRWAAAGNGPTWITRQLNKQGIAPPRGHKSTRWWVHVVQRMLANQTYAGTMYLNRFNQEGKRKNRYLPPERRVRASERPRTEWVAVQVPAIVDAALWAQVRSILGDHRRRWAGRHSGHTYLASHLIRCGICGSPMHGATATQGRRRRHYYRCNGKYGERRLACDMPHLPAEALDQALWAELRSWLIEPNRFRQAQQRALAARNGAQLADTALLRAQRQEAAADIARLDALIRKGSVRENEVRSALRGLRERESALSGQLRAPEGARNTTFGAFPPEVVHRWSEHERQAYVRGLLREVLVFPDGRLEVTPLAVPPATLSRKNLVPS